MQESRYCEDIIAQIKADLTRRGYLNEHDRLGHFEAKVPLDVLLGLAKRHCDARFFGIQVKAPKRRKANFTWELTSTAGQYEAIVVKWPSFIVYGLPYYDSPVQAPHALSLTGFVLPKCLPRNHVSMIDSQAQLPYELVLDLGLTYLGWRSPEIRAVAMELGLEEFARRMEIIQRGNPLGWIRHRPDKEHQRKQKEAEGAAARVIADMGLTSEMLKTDRSGIIDSIWQQSFSKFWTSDGLVRVHLSLRTHVVRLPGNNTLICSSHIRVKDAFESYEKPVQLPKSSYDHTRTEVKSLRWDDLLAAIDRDEFGWKATEMDEPGVREAFRESRLSADDLLVWYSHLHQVFYAIEARRVVSGDEQVLGTVADPLTAALGPDTRRRLWDTARKKGVAASTLLETIVEDYFKTGGNPP